MTTSSPSNSKASSRTSSACGSSPSRKRLAASITTFRREDCISSSKRRPFSAEATTLFTSGSNASVTSYSSAISSARSMDASRSCQASGTSFSGWERHMSSGSCVPVHSVITDVPLPASTREYSEPSQPVAPLPGIRVDHVEGSGYGGHGEIPLVQLYPDALGQLRGYILGHIGQTGAGHVELHAADPVRSYRVERLPE